MKVEVSCRSSTDVNNILPSCMCPVVKRPLLVKTQTDSAASLTNLNGSSVEYDVISLHEASSLYKLNYQPGKQELQQDSTAEIAALQQRLSLVTSFSPSPANEKQNPNVKHEVADIFSQKHTLSNSSKLFSSFRTLPKTFCHLHRSFLLQKDKFTFCKILQLIYLFQMLLMSATAAAPGVWWSPGTNLKLVNSSRICHWARQVGGPQFDMCLRQATVVQQIQKGIDMGMDACQHELRQYRWNCSQQSKTYFARVMFQDVRETGFVHALTAAAITHQVTSACAKGDISECKCVNHKKLKNRLLRLEAQKHNVTINEVKLKNAVEKFNWGGCRDNIEYGIQKSKEFLDFRHVTGLRKRSTLSNKLRAHNEDAGRRAISNFMKKDCTCHGLTGACTMWACWKVMPPFKEVQRRLRSKYNMAVRVIEKNDGETLMPIPRPKNKRSKKKQTRNIRSTSMNSATSQARRAISHSHVSGRVRKVSRRRYRPLTRRQNSRKKLTPNDIIFFQKSPSFCKVSKRHGSMGTRGRQCDNSTIGYGSCRYLCCGRGYRTVNEIKIESCNCQFQFCCEVQCDQCVSNITSHYCL